MRRKTLNRLFQLGLKLSVVVALVTLLNAPSLAQEPPSRFYVIGNSLTWDTVPSQLDGDTQWHVDCGVPLTYIHANPGKPCVNTSTLWPKALAEKQYDVISVQPHYGSTLDQDVETISTWMKLQPQAVFVIHTGWAFQTERAKEFASYAAPQQMEHSPNYIRALIARLHELHPEREIRQTYAQNLLAQVAADITAGKAPLSDLKELYRDSIHLTVSHGRYLMHNAMRHALGQKPSAAGFKDLDPGLTEYLDGVLALLSTAPADKALLLQIVSPDTEVDRATLIAKLSTKDLQSKMTALLPEIQRALAARPRTLKLLAEVEKVGGEVICTPSAPEWLYLATGDEGLEIFDVPTSVNLYNGNNPLKGKGGRNDLVNDDWLELLRGYTTLRKVDLANCDVHGEGLRHLGALKGLLELNLTLTPVSDDGLQHLGGLTELRSLGLASTQCTGTGFAHLKGLKNLASVNFHFTPLNDAGLKAISQVPISDRLWFAHTHFTDEGAKALQSQNKLKRCGIGSKEADSSGEAVAALVGAPLEDLALLDNQATDAGIAHAAKIKTLKKLDVSYGPTVTDASLGAVAELPALEEFKIGSAQVTDEGILKLAASKSLKKVSLNRLKNVTPEGIEKLRQAKPELQIDAK